MKSRQIVCALRFFYGVTLGQANTYVIKNSASAFANAEFFENRNLKLDDLTAKQVAPSDQGRPTTSKGYQHVV